MRALIPLGLAAGLLALMVPPASARPPTPPAACPAGTPANRQTCPADPGVTLIDATPAPTPQVSVCSDALSWTPAACPGIPQPVLTPVASPTSTAGAGEGGGGGGILSQLGGLFSGLDPFTWLNNLVTAAVRPVFTAFGSVAFTTPDLLANDAVRRMWLTMLAISDASLLLVVLWRAHLATWDGLLTRARADGGVGRIFLGAVGAHLNLVLLAPLASVANALTSALLAVGGDNIQVRVQGLIPLVVASAANPLMTLLMLVVVVMAMLVLFWSLVRWLVLAIVTALGPPANLALAVDQDQLTRAWWRCQFLLLLCPVLQVVAYDMAVWLFFSASGSLLPSGDTLLQAMAMLILLWSLYQIPKQALRRAAAPLMGAYDAAKGKVKLTLGLAALGVGAASGLGVAGLGSRGFSVHGLLRGLVVRAGRGRKPQRRPAPSSRSAPRSKGATP